MQRITGFILPPASYLTILYSLVLSQSTVSPDISAMEFTPPYQHDLYVCYFRHQAENHPALQHADAQGSEVFAVMDIEESFAEFRVGVKPKDYIFRLFNYTYEIIKDETGQYKKMLEGGFLVAKHVGQRDAAPSAVIAARASAEKVVDDIIQNMLADSENGHIMLPYALESGGNISVTPTGLVGDGTYIGYRCIFQFENFFSNCPEDNVIATAYGGATPNELC